MCIYESKYKGAINSKSEANTEIKRCHDGLEYFREWKQKVNNTIGCIEILIEKTNSIADLCDGIELNGKPIDEGIRHYPNGNGEVYAIRLGIINKALIRLIEEINKSIDELSNSLEKAKNKKNEAERTLRNTPKPPCGKCNECLGEGLGTQ